MRSCDRLGPGARRRAQTSPGPAVILCVAANPAIDVTYRVAGLEVGAVHRIREVRAVPGGKAVNVARTLAALRHPVTLTGLAGGLAGTQLRRGVAEAGITERLVEVGGETRRTVAVVDDAGGVTGLWEPGSEISPVEWDRLVAEVAAAADGHDVAVVSGSLPPGAPPDGYARLIGVLHAAGALVVLDADGDALHRALPAGPDVVKPNAEELARAAARLAGGEAATIESAGPAASRTIQAASSGRAPTEAAAALRAAGAGTVVASAGAEGLLVVTPGGSWAARPVEEVRGNPTGAGDAVVAAVARGLDRGDAWPEIVADAVALSAAAVASPVAGGYSPAHYRDHRQRTHVEEVGS